MTDIDDDLVHSWRNDSQLNTSCSPAAGSSHGPPSTNALKESNHPDKQPPGAPASDSDVDAAFKKMVVSPKQTPVTLPHDGPGVAGPSSGASQQQSVSTQDIQDKQPAGQQGGQKASQPRRSNNASTAARGGGHPSPAASPRGSGGRHRTIPAEFDRSQDGKKTTGRLWSPADATQGLPGSTGSSGQQQPQQQQQYDSHQRKKKKHTSTRSGSDSQHAAASQKPQQPQNTGQSQQQSSAEATVPVMNTITHDALVDEVKGIYSGLVMVESKCMEIASVQSAYRDSNQELTKEQWQALIALHRTLLHEHHDFFLASQHPAAKQPLRQLAAKYAMPARMWRHGIHSFLELLRTKLPHSLEFMLSFIYIAYTNTALLYETIPAFEDTWVECLGDLARYRMAIEDESVKDRDIWTEVARGWYLKVSNRQPSIGRLYHHLAILARPDALQQLFYYAKSFCVSMPFPSARDSIMTLLEPVFQSQPTKELLDIDTAFIRVHGVLFSGNHKDELQPSLDAFVEQLPRRLDEADKEWLQNGYHIGIALTCALLGYGEAENVIMRDMGWFKPDAAKAGQPPNQRGSPECFSTALSFTMKICQIVVERRIDAPVMKEDGESEGDAEVERLPDANVLPFMHTIFAFLLSVSQNTKAMTNFATAFPWAQTATYLNALLQYCVKEEFRSRHDDTSTFPGKRREKDKNRPLPEDFAMRGLLFTKGYYPADWFSEHDMEEDEKLFEVPSLATTRCERILWIARRLAETGDWLIWDDNEREFTVVGIT